MGACTSAEQSADAKRYHAADMMNYRTLMKAIHPALDEPPEPVPELNIIMRELPPPNLVPALKDPTRMKPLVTPPPALVHPDVMTPALGYNRSPPAHHQPTCSPSTTPGQELSPIMPVANGGTRVSSFENADPPELAGCSLTDPPPSTSLHLEQLTFIAAPHSISVSEDTATPAAAVEAPVHSPAAVVTATSASTTSSSGGEGSLNDEDRLDGHSFTPPPVNTGSFLSPPTNGSGAMGQSFALASPPATGAATFFNSGQRHVRFSPALQDASQDSKHTPLARCKKGPSRHICPGITPLVPKPNNGSFSSHFAGSDTEDMESSGSPAGTPYVGSFTFTAAF